MKRATNPTVTEAVKAMRRANRARIVADLREGRVQRAATYADRKKVASKKACRGRVTID